MASPIDGIKGAADQKTVVNFYSFKAITDCGSFFSQTCDKVQTSSFAVEKHHGSNTIRFKQSMEHRSSTSKLFTSFSSSFSNF